MIFPETKWVLLFQQASAKEIDDRKPQLDKITRRAEELSKSADQYDSERIKKQVSSMSTLWSNVCRLLSTSMQSLADIVRHFEQFSRLHETLSHWLLTIESSVSRELEESFLSIPDDQGDTVFQVWLFVCLFDGSYLSDTFHSSHFLLLGLGLKGTTSRVPILKSVA